MRIRTSSDLGALVRARRRALKLPQAELAARVGVSRKWVVETEGGKHRTAVRLVLRTLATLGLELSVQEARPAPTGRDLADVVRAHRKGPPAR